MEKIGRRYGVIDILIFLEIVFRFSSIYSMIVLLDKYLRSVWFLGTTEARLKAVHDRCSYAMRRGLIRCRQTALVNVP